MPDAGLRRAQEEVPTSRWEFFQDKTAVGGGDVGEDRLWDGLRGGEGPVETPVRVSF